MADWGQGMPQSHTKQQASPERFTWGGRGRDTEVASKRGCKERRAGRGDTGFMRGIVLEHRENM